MSTYPQSPDGAWYWDGRRWLPTGVAPGPLPSSLGRRRGSHWDGRELVVRSTRLPFVPAAVMFPVLIALEVLVLVLDTEAATTMPGGLPPLLIASLVVLELGVVVIIGCWLYFLSAALRPPTLRFSARGIVARQPWRGSFYIPWDAVVQIGTHGRARLLLTVEVSEDFWSYLGRRWMPRWSAPFAFGTPPRRASMVMIPPRGTGMEMVDILRCLRQVAPAGIPVGAAPGAVAPLH